MPRPNLALVRPDSAVSAIMRAPVVTVTEDVSLAELAEILSENDIGAAAVVRHDKVLGVISERDVVAQLAAGVSMDDTSVGDVMSTDLLTIDPDETIISAAQRANAALVRHLPVLDADGEAVGVVSVRDLLIVLVSAVSQE